MQRIMLKSKIHQATLTGSNLNYEGSITIDEDLMEKANLLPGEQVHVLDINNGARFITYVIAGDRGTGDILLNGAAARLGLAFCIGLSEEAKTIDKILSQHFEVVSVCCKACALEKKDFDLETVSSNEHEVMCNPAGQATLLNQAGTELNILCGLCVGHDAILAKTSDAPVITLIAKDRVLAHNPAGAIYSRYLRKTLLDENA